MSRTRRATPIRARASKEARRSRASVYVLVLATATIAGVAAMAGIGLAQSAQRAAFAAADWERASIEAQSGLELATAQMNSSATWKSTAVSGSVLPSIDMDGSRVRLVYVDEADGNFTTGNDPVRIYAAATTNSSTRVLSVQATSLSSTPLDALRCAVHSGSNLTNQAALRLGGALSSNATLTNNNTIVGSVEAPTITNIGTVQGFVVSGAPVKTMPSTGIVGDLTGRATVITTAIATSTFSSVLWSSARSPALVTNAQGIYHIKVQPAHTVVFSKLRVKATIVISLTSTSTLTLKDQILWDPASASLPSLVIVAEPGATINLAGSTSSLAEVALIGNFNPASDPYGGVSDTDTTDSYPSEFHGIIHVIGSGASVNIGQDFKLIGSLISESRVVINQSCSLAADPALYASPPSGYTVPGVWRPVQGSMRWETADTFRSVTGQGASDTTRGNTGLWGTVTGVLGGLPTGTP